MQEEEPEPEEEVYQPPEELKVPAGMEVPTTEKQNAIIEKTAKFVSKQGIQMEIMLKTKQKDNDQFSFLNYEDQLNAYYRHVIQMIKSGRYQPKEVKKQRLSESEDHGSYLHPSLSTSSVDSIPNDNILTRINLPSGQMANTAYAALVKRLSKHTGRNSPVPSQQTAHSSNGTTTTYHQSNNPASSTNGGPPPLAPPPLPPFAAETTEYENYPSGASGQYISPESQPQPPGLETVVLPGGQPPPPGTVPLHPPPPPPHLAGSTNQLSQVEVKPAQELVIPTAELKGVIDKMAVYVARNGPDFEYIVCNQKNDRFTFLQPTNKYNPYYERMKKRALKEHEDHIAREKKLAAEAEEERRLQNKAAVSFSIKSKENEAPPASSKKTKAILYESSDDEDGEDGEKKAHNFDSDSASASLGDDQSQHSDGAGPVEKSPRSVEDIEKRHAETKLKDKLAMAAREKLGQVSKEKQLQAERKRKAAMFINMIKNLTGESEPPSTEGEPPVILPKRSHTDDEDSDEVEAKYRLDSPVISMAGSSPSPPRGGSIPKTGSLAQLNIDYARRSVSRERSGTKSPLATKLRTKTSRRSRSRSPKHQRSRSPKRRHSRSPARHKSRSPKKRKHRSRTPPSAYTAVRRSSSPSPSGRSRSRTPLQYRVRKPKHSSPPVHSRSRRKSRSKSPPKHKRKKARSRSRERAKRRKSRSRSRERSKKSSKKRKSRSRSPHRKKTSKEERFIDSFVTTPAAKKSSPDDAKPEKVPEMIIIPDEETQSSPERVDNLPTTAVPTEGSSTSTTTSTTPTPASSGTAKVSEDLVSKVRAMLKASRQAIMEEEAAFLDS